MPVFQRHCIACPSILWTCSGSARCAQVRWYGHSEDAVDTKELQFKAAMHKLNTNPGAFKRIYGTSSHGEELKGDSVPGVLHLIVSKFASATAQAHGGRGCNLPASV